MTEDGGNVRPVRTLTVKNFSVIKEAKLEFGRITVLIGPQASGKSLLCKLAYFLGGEVPSIAIESLLDRNSWDEFQETVNREFRKRFLPTETETGWLVDHTAVFFASHEYEIQLRGTGTLLTSRIKCSFNDRFENLYRALAGNSSKRLWDLDVSRDELRQSLFVEIGLLLNGKYAQSTTYMPSGRSLFSDPSISIVALQNPDIDPITKRFAGLIAWDSRWKAGYLTTGRGIIQEVEKGIYRIAGGAVNTKDGRPFFRSDDGRNLPLSVQSSGTLELLPMLNVVDQLACFQEHAYARASAAKISPLADISEHKPLVYLEEPESNIFPRTQYEVVQLFAWLANDPILDFDWVITTHSPYVLSAYNNLIEAGQAARNNPKVRDEIAKIVPEQYWIKEGDFKAYAIENGKLKSILNESGFVEANYLDQVSEAIGDEFDKLLRLEYERAKVS